MIAHTSNRLYDDFDHVFEFLEKSTDDSMSEENVSSAIGYLLDLRKEFLTQAISKDVAEEFPVGDTTYDEPIKVERQAGVNFVGMRLPVNSRKSMVAIVPASFPTSGFSIPSITGSVSAPDTLGNPKRKFDWGQSGRNKRGNRKITSNSFSNYLTPHKGALEDMPITNLFDFWSWVEYQDFFCQPLKESLLNDLHIKSASSGEVGGSYAHEESKTTEDSTCLSSMSDTCWEDTEIIPFYYQRLLGCLVLNGTSWSQSKIYESMYCTNDQENLWMYEPGKAEVLDGSFAKFPMLPNDHKLDQSEVHVMDVSRIPLKVKTTAVLGMCGILKKDMIYFENGVDEAEKKAERNVNSDEISGGLRQLITDSAQIEGEIVSRVANMRENISSGFQLGSNKNDGDIRKQKEYERSTYTKWHKCLQRHNFDGVSGSVKKHSNMSTLAISTPSFAELPW